MSGRFFANLHRRSLLIVMLMIISLALAVLLGRWLAVVQAPLTRYAVGRQLLENGAPDQAAHLFEDPLWKGAALYRAGRFHRAAGAFVTDDSVTGLYNLGNAYARLGEYRGAAAAYEAVLRRQPTHEDALFNLELVRAAQKRAQELEQESRETVEAGNWEDGLLEDERESDRRSADEQQAGEEGEDSSESAERPPGEQEATAGAMEPAASDGETAEEGAGGSEQEGERADASVFSLSGSDDGQADDLSPDDLPPEDSEVQGGVIDRAREEAMADEILLRRIEDDPALVLKARLNMALRRQRAGR